MFDVVRVFTNKKNSQKLCPTLADGTTVVINCSGRGDKDVNTAAKFLNLA